MKIRTISIALVAALSLITYVPTFGNSYTYTNYKVHFEKKVSTTEAAAQIASKSLTLFKSIGNTTINFMRNHPKIAIGIVGIWGAHQLYKKYPPIRTAVDTTNTYVIKPTVKIVNCIVNNPLSHCLLAAGVGAITATIVTNMLNDQKLQQATIKIILENGTEKTFNCAASKIDETIKASGKAKTVYITIANQGSQLFQFMKDSIVNFPLIASLRDIATMPKGI